MMKTNIEADTKKLTHVRTPMKNYNNTHTLQAARFSAALRFRNRAFWSDPQFFLKSDPHPTFKYLQIKRFFCYLLDKDILKQ